jgi:hypothetical protein
MDPEKNKGKVPGPNHYCQYLDSTIVYEDQYQQ